MFVYFNGLILGLSLIIALGPQNIFLIKQGIRKNHPLLSAMVCFFCDLILIVGSITSLHELILMRPILQMWLMLFGSLFLLYYALKALRNTFATTSASMEHTLQPHNKAQIIFFSTWV